MPRDAIAMPYADVMARHGFIPANHAEARFERVTARKLYDEAGEELPGWLRIYNEDRKKTLHVATDAYQLITNEEAFTAFEDAIGQSELRSGNMQIGTDYSHEGGRIFRQYLFPDHLVPVKPGVDVALRIVMFNSYDGTMGFRGQAGAFNFVCANTSILGHEVAGFKMRHAGKADVSEGARRLVDAAEAFVRETDAWKVWPSIPVSDQQAVEVFKAMPGASDSTVEHLTLAWVTARDRDPHQGGANLWCLYNVLTAWATHTETSGRGKANAAAARYGREGAVRKALDTKPWKLLAA
jgi:hypothetical protein